MKTKHILWFLPLLLVGCGETDPQQLKEKLIGGPAEERVIAVGVQRIDTVGGLVRNSYPGYLEEGNTVDISFRELTFNELIRSETLFTVFAVNEGIIEC